MTQPLLSIVLAHKNRKQLLHTTLSYWGRQERFAEGEIEVVVVDDGSRDMPNDVVAQFPYARCLNLGGDTARKGPTVAWNAGLKEARGLVKACSHPEIVPNKHCGRFLYGACTGDESMLEDLDIWLPGRESTWDGKVNERRVKGSVHAQRLSEFAVRANITVLRLKAEHNELLAGGIDPDDLYQLGGFWDFETEFGRHTNREIMRRFRGFYWNNLFAMRDELWHWSGYFRESNDWGVDDTDSQERNIFLGISYAFSDQALAYHQWHGPEFRGGILDLFKYTDLDSARLLHLYPELRDYPLNLKREPFWE